MKLMVLPNNFRGKKGEKFVTIFMLCIITVLLIWIMRLLIVIKRQNYIKLQMTVEENGWSEDKAKEIAEKALK